MEKLVANLTGRAKRHTLMGREYLVAPATLIVPGVLNGSQGPLFYPEEEVSRNVAAWENVPILAYHPASSASGKSPGVLDKQGIGQVYSPRYENGLRADLWFDEERTKQVDPRIHDALINGTSIELSTGLGVDSEAAEEGSSFLTPDGPIEYKAVARNYRPDHLAILPDQVGACSLKDGCGVFNQQDPKWNPMSIAVAKKTGKTAELLDVRPSYLVFRSEDGVFKVGYEKTEGSEEVALADPVAVEQKTIYAEVGNQDSQPGSSDILLNEEPDMAEMKTEDRKAVIDGLIANSCCWDEKDRAELEAMTDNQLTRTKEAAEKAVENEQLLAAAEKGFNDGRDEINFNREKREWSKKTKEEPVENEENKDVLSDEDKAVLNYGREMMQKERKDLIEQITVNVSDDAKPGHVTNLQKKSIEDLREIASLMPKPEVQNHYPGQPADIANRKKLDQEDMLEEPDDEDFIANSVFAQKA
jgi:Spy/CpxP family protein refolding chaperone